MSEQPVDDAPIRVFLVDDQELVRAGFRMVLDAQDDMTVVGEAGDGAAALAAVPQARPDVVLMDIRMPQTDGLSATPAVVRDGARVLVLTTYDNDENLYRAFQAGASGFVLKTAHPDDLVHAVRVVARGDSLIQPEITRRLIERFAAPPPAPPAWAGRLSERERDVLDLMASGLSNAEIATRLVLAEPTVKTHVAAVLSKMGVRDRLQAVVTAYASGYVEGDR